jgi:hypothetical protein
MEHWREHGKPQVMLYFSQQHPHPQSPEDAAQILALMEFKAEVQKQVLTADYSDELDFERRVRNHLIGYLLNLRPQDGHTDAPRPDLLYSVSSSPLLLRQGGLSERSGDIAITIRRSAPLESALSVNVDVHLYTNAYIKASDIDDPSMMQCAVLGPDGPQPNRPFNSMTGRLECDSRAHIVFESVPLSFDKDEELRTLRVSDLCIDTTSCIETPIAVVQFIDSITKKTIAGGGSAVTLGIPVKSYRFWLENPNDNRLPLSVSSAIGLNEQMSPGQRSDISLTLCAMFEESFPSAFQPTPDGPQKAQDNSRTCFKVVFLNAPDNVDVFVTNLDVIRSSTGDVGKARAVLISPAAEESQSESCYSARETVSGTKVDLTELSRVDGKMTAMWHYIEPPSINSPTSIPYFAGDVRRLCFGIVIRVKKSDIVQSFPTQILGGIVARFAGEQSQVFYGYTGPQDAISFNLYDAVHGDLSSVPLTQATLNAFVDSSRIYHEIQETLPKMFFNGSLSLDYDYSERLTRTPFLKVLQATGHKSLADVERGLREHSESLRRICVAYVMLSRAPFFARSTTLALYAVFAVARQGDIGKLLAFFDEIGMDFYRDSDHTQRYAYALQIMAIVSSAAANRGVQ